MKTEKNYFTAAELANLLKEIGEKKVAEEDGKGVLPDLDYVIPTESDRVLTKPGFNISAVVDLGGSEGIYAIVFLEGVFDETRKFGKVEMLTIKTLEDSYHAFIGMGILANHIAYLGMKMLDESLSRFD